MCDRDRALPHINPWGVDRFFLEKIHSHLFFLSFSPLSANHPCDFFPLASWLLGICMLTHTLTHIRTCTHTYAPCRLWSLALAKGRYGSSTGVLSSFFLVLLPQNGNPRNFNTILACGTWGVPPFGTSTKGTG